MRLIAVLLAVGVLAGLALGGSPGRMSLGDVRWRWAAVVGLVLQAAPWPDGFDWLELPLLYASFTLLVAFALANVRLRGFELITVGLLLNFLVIGLNAGMPVSREALVASDQLDSLNYLERYGGAKHHLADDGDRLTFLGDVIAIPAPIAQAISVGDIFTYSGAALFIALGMNGRLVRTHRPAIAPDPKAATDG
jgi:hypothetical protein